MDGGTGVDTDTDGDCDDDGVLAVGDCDDPCSVYGVSHGCRL